MPPSRASDPGQHSFGQTACAAPRPDEQGLGLGGNLAAIGVLAGADIPDRTPESSPPAADSCGRSPMRIGSVGLRTGVVGAQLLLSVACTAPTGVVSSSPTATGVVTAVPSAIGAPSPAIRDLTLAASGDVRGDHALVMQANAPSVAG